MADGNGNLGGHKIIRRGELQLQFPGIYRGIRLIQYPSNLAVFVYSLCFEKNDETNRKSKRKSYIHNPPATQGTFAVGYSVWEG